MERRRPTPFQSATRHPSPDQKRRHPSAFKSDLLLRFSFLQMSTVDVHIREAIDIFETGGTKRLAKASINRIPVIRITPRNRVDSSGEPISCSICLQVSILMIQSTPRQSAVLESPGQFRWRPYAAMLTDWSCPSFYCYGDRWVTVDPCEADDDMRSYARCLRTCKLVGMDGVENYAPQRVGMQFGFDQDLPGSILHGHGAWELALAARGGGGERVRFYLPPRFYEPCATRRFLDWQKLCALDRMDEVGEMAKQRKREKAKKRRLRRNRRHPIKDTCLMPNSETCLRIGTGDLHGDSASPVGEEPTKLRAHGDEQMRTGKEEILTEDGENQMGSSGDAGAVKRMRTTAFGEASALEVFDRVLDRDKEGWVLETNAQQSSYDSNISKMPEAGLSPSGITEIGRDDEKLQTMAAGEKADDDITSKDAQEVSYGFFMMEDPESSDEELQRQKDLEFEKEVAQMKAEIASLRALIRELESNSPQMEPARTSHVQPRGQVAL